MAEVNNHYNENYFAWQRVRGEFFGWASLKKFEKYITAESEVLDFGCGEHAVLTAILRSRGMTCDAYDPLYDFSALSATALAWP